MLVQCPSTGEHGCSINTTVVFIYSSAKGGNDRMINLIENAGGCCSIDEKAGGREGKKKIKRPVVQ